jgi:hypothetical protein
MHHPKLVGLVIGPWNDPAGKVPNPVIQHTGILPGRRARCPRYDPLRPGRTAYEINLNAEQGGNSRTRQPTRIFAEAAATALAWLVG